MMIAQLRAQGGRLRGGRAGRSLPAKQTGFAGRNVVHTERNGLSPAGNLNLDADDAAIDVPQVGAVPGTYYRLAADEHERIAEIFAADFCSDAESLDYIREGFERGYLMDPHTATCFKAYDTCRDKPLKTIVYSTAEWTKFSPVIANALTGEIDTHDIDALKSIASEAGIEIPAIISGLFDKEITQKTIIEKDEIESEILSFL